MTLDDVVVKAGDADPAVVALERNDRLPRTLKHFHTAIDRAKWRIAVGMRRPFARLAVRLQAVAGLVQQFRGGFVLLVLEQSAVATPEVVLEALVGRSAIGRSSSARTSRSAACLASCSRSSRTRCR